ncbi:hypothetical protein [Tenggerimyces flavus]|uniref:Uncharacterized protein n=1 Tax=Tenggerimyces flavus TaxID=1708749 RepID=A0ABV7YR55_9ACTN|nr:hypothetical protein [Tenggerimyces flavus]MBM7786454.1 membrane-bound lytic murein transglycosylase B [Tenggerimyces flavus]
MRRRILGPVAVVLAIEAPLGLALALAMALQSYAVAEARLAQSRPGCRLSWVTLAGIGAVESDHGQHGGRTLRADGRDLSIPTGWTAAVLSYNQTYEYLNTVHARATSYATSSRG